MAMFAFSVVTLLSATLLLQVVEGKVRCYVCSWQSPSYGSTNLTDLCSHYNFDPTYAVVIECDSGCEAVSIRRSKNENVINFYKNCIKPTKTASTPEDKCMSTEDKMHYTTTCECTGDLCNGARRTGGGGGGTGGYLVLLTLLTVMFPLKVLTN